MVAILYHRNIPLTSTNYRGTVIVIRKAQIANVLPMDKQVAVISALAEGSGIRQIERITGVHRDTIMRLGVLVGKGCTTLLDDKMRNLFCKQQAAHMKARCPIQSLNVTRGSQSHERLPSPPVPGKLDIGIRKAVERLQSCGIETFESCEGGPNHSYPEPTIRFYGTPEAGWRAVGICLAHGLPIAQLRRVWSVLDASEPTGPHREITFRGRLC